MYGVLCRFRSQLRKPNSVDDEVLRKQDSNGDNNAPRVRSSSRRRDGGDSGLAKYSSDDEDLMGDSKWKLELAWLTKALEPALQVCRWALPAGLFITISHSKC